MYSYSNFIICSVSGVISAIAFVSRYVCFLEFFLQYIYVYIYMYIYIVLFLEFFLQYIYSIFFFFNKGSAHFHYRTNQFIIKITQDAIKKNICWYGAFRNYQKTLTPIFSAIKNLNKTIYCFSQKAWKNKFRKSLNLYNC